MKNIKEVLLDVDTKIPTEDYVNYIQRLVGKDLETLLVNEYNELLIKEKFSNIIIENLKKDTLFLLDHIISVSEEVRPIIQDLI